jgi:hypothetical protein
MLALATTTPWLAAATRELDAESRAQHFLSWWADRPAGAPPKYFPTMNRLQPGWLAMYRCNERLAFVHSGCDSLRLGFGTECRRPKFQHNIAGHSTNSSRLDRASLEW